MMEKGKLYFDTKSRYVLYCTRNEHYIIVIPQGELEHRESKYNNTYKELEYLDVFRTKYNGIYFYNKTYIDKVKEFLENEAKCF